MNKVKTIISHCRRKKVMINHWGYEGKLYREEAMKAEHSKPRQEFFHVQGLRIPRDTDWCEVTTNRYLKETNESPKSLITVLRLD